MGPAAPIKDLSTRIHRSLAEEISRRTLWRSSGYAEIWLDGEKIELLSECNLPEDIEDPLYGKVWLPRKFKMGIAIAPRNDVDIFSQDVGFVPARRRRRGRRLLHLRRRRLRHEPRPALHPPLPRPAPRLCEARERGGCHAGHRHHPARPRQPRGTQAGAHEIPRRDARASSGSAPKCNAACPASRSRP